jgi:hypothetical protein
MKTIAWAAVAALSGLGLLAVAPTASADCVETTSLPPAGYVCSGDSWCSVNICAIPLCAVETSKLSVGCVLVDDFTSNGCVVYAVNSVGVACVYNGHQVCVDSLKIVCLFN